MKNNKANILYSWMLLFCFIAGQYVVYTHRHKIIAGIAAKAKTTANSTSHSVVQEKCSFCDAMHHINAVIDCYSYCSLNIVTKHFYKVYNYDFVSTALILSADRAPPVTTRC